MTGELRVDANPSEACIGIRRLKKLRDRSETHSVHTHRDTDRGGAVILGHEVITSPANRRYVIQGGVCSWQIANLSESSERAGDEKRAWVNREC